MERTREGAASAAIPGAPEKMATPTSTANNEAAGIGETLASLQNQTIVPDRIIVVADNCTDNTGAISLAAGAEVVSTVGNTDKKAGALNHVLADLLPDAAAEDMILVQEGAPVLLSAKFDTDEPFIVAD